MRNLYRNVTVLLTVFFFPVLVSAQSTVIDDFAYDTPEKADRVWRAIGPSPRTRRAEQGNLTFPVPFNSDRDRVYWDRHVQLDLSPYDTITLELTAPHPDAMRSLAVYLESGDGWYVWNRPLREAGRQTLQMMRADFDTEGAPAGWDRINRIRLSPWKGTPRNTTLTLHRLAAETPGILLVRGAGLNAGEMNVARRATQRISQWLGDMNLAHAVIDSDEVNAERLRRAATVVLPYNPALSERERSALRGFIARGGRVMVFYSADAALADMLGFRMGSYMAAEGPGQWSAFAFPDYHDLRLPERVYQESWNIRPLYPVSTDARVLAWWEDARGRRTQNPAWVASDKGVWMSHILLQGDDENKRALVAGLLGHLHPPVWRAIARHALDNVGKIGPYASLRESQRGIEAAAQAAPERDRIRQLLRETEEQERRMRTLYRAERFPETVDVQRAIRRNLLEAYARAQQPEHDEQRGVWDHRGTGLYPGDWDRTAQLLVEHGINTLYVNMLWGGVAHYESDVLPRSATFRMYGDQLEQCIRAARRHGLKVHVWIVCWNLTGAPDEFVVRKRAAGRTIVSSNGDPMPWLNPAHPDNVRLMVDSLKEVADEYDIDGIHLDYIRYPNRNACYSDYTRQRFEEWLGRKVSSWPADALPEGRLDESFRRFRVDQINLAVRAVHEGVGKPHPNLKVSAAVWGGYPNVIDSIGQDWVSWLERDELDFVVTMNYANDHSRFAHLTRTQLALPNASGRIYPGLGVTSSESQLSPDQVILQINSARRLGAPGWVLFDLNNTLRAETLPALRLGITREP